MSDLLHSFDQFFAGEKPYNSSGAFGQQVGNESYRVTYTGSQRGELRDRIEQLESQLANARNEALEEALLRCRPLGSTIDDQFNCGYLRGYHECEAAIRSLKDKP